MFYKQIEDLKNIAENLRRQGKSEDQIKQAISLYLIESKNKINPNGDLNVN